MERRRIKEIVFKNNNPVQKALFGGTSRVTRVWPRAGAVVLEAASQLVLGNRFLLAVGRRRGRAVARRLRSFERFLVIPDIHIGDAVMTQAALTGLRDFFPSARIDYIVNRTAFPLVEGNPEATRVLPFFAGGTLISRDDLAALRALVHREKYDLCLNFSTFLHGRDILPNGSGILNTIDRAPLVVRNERDASRINHFMHHEYWLIREVFSGIVPLRRETSFSGVRLTLRESARELALRFVSRAVPPGGHPIILVNPDGASPYTRIPLSGLTELVTRLGAMDVAILVNGGHTEPGIGERLRASLPAELRARVGIIPPELPIDAYAALIDLCEAFISGDTGPLHIAAARRFPFSGNVPFRNRTAVLSCFGGTPARMSGYDSFQAGFLPANQDAPSWNFTAGSPCRNITCLNKFFKTCRTVRCFEEMDVAGMAERVRAHLASLG